MNFEYKGKNFDLDKYLIQLKIHNNKTFLVCEYFNIVIVVQNDNIEKALEDLTNERKKRIMSFLDIGLDLPIIVKEKQIAQRKKSWASRIAKIVIASIVLFIAVMLFTMFNYVSNFTNYIINQISEKAQQALQPSKLTSITRSIANALERVTPERKEEIRQDCRRITKVLYPIASELKPLWLDINEKNSLANSSNSNSGNAKNAYPKK